MIKKLSVKNFKSIKELEIDCKRINLFIGEPNTGKSNILEVLGLLSYGGHGNVPLREYVRLQTPQNLFYDNLTDETIEMKVLKQETDEVYEINMLGRFEAEEFRFTSNFGGFNLDYSGELTGNSNFPTPQLRSVKFYTFERQNEFEGKQLSFLMPPHGSNMFGIVMGQKRLRASMARFLNDLGFKLVLRPQARTFESQKQIEDENVDLAFGYPYISISDTLQRMIFYTVVMESNENSTLIFEEPESHAFPDYIVYMGRKIAFDEKNQYFIATHNPYFLLSILEKAPKDDVSVFVTYFEDYQTKVKCLNDEEMSELMVYDPFGNLDRLIGRLESFVEEEEQ